MSFRDFDAAIAETAAVPVRLRLLGRDWELPASAPAAVMLRLQRLQAQMAMLAAGKDLDPAQIIDEDLSVERIVAALAGQDMLDAWLAAGITWDQLRAVCAWLYGVYNGEADPAGEAPAANRAARRAKPKKAQGGRSSGSGRSSKPTSPASTASKTSGRR